MWTCASVLLDLQTAAPTDRRALLRAASSLTLILVVAILCVLIVAILLLRRHRRNIVGHGARRKRRHRSDPWFESARRVTREDVAPRPSEHDTVDLDPSELTEGDVDHGFDGEPPDQGWDNDIGPEESRGPQVFGDGPDDPPRPPRRPPPRPKRPPEGGSQPPPSPPQTPDNP